MYGSWRPGTVAPWRAPTDVARVLTYHRVGPDRFDPFCIDPRGFESQVKLLSEQGRAINLSSLRDFLAGRADLPANACLVTIDDGMISTLTEVLPVLAKWGVPAIAFVSANLLGRASGQYGERYLTWDELKIVADSGLVEVGSHAYSHRSLGSMPADEARAEILKSRDVLQQFLGRDVCSFAYPFGTRGDFNDSTEQALRDAGFSIAFHSMHGPIRRGMNALSLPRVKVEGGESLFLFSLLSRGGIDAWRLVDNTMWRLQRARVEIE